MDDPSDWAAEAPGQKPEFELMAENRLANDGAEHLLRVGRFGNLPAVARAAYVHMNGPFDPDNEPPHETFDAFAAEIDRVVGPDNSIFRGISEAGEPHTFYLERVRP